MYAMGLRPWASTRTSNRSSGWEAPRRRHAHVRHGPVAMAFDSYQQLLLPVGGNATDQIFIFDDGVYPSGATSFSEPRACCFF